MPNPLPGSRCLRLRCDQSAGRRDKIHMLTHMQIQSQFIGNSHGHAIQAFQRFCQTRLKIAADLTEMLDGQPSHALRRIDQRPVQWTALHRFTNFFGSVTL